ncbi:MAG: sensor histidine kinase [Prochlorotrichaceae cyanobacterium]
MKSLPERLTVLILVLMLVTVLDYITPPEYIFGYLYSVAILLTAHSNLPRRAIATVTGLSMGLTALGLLLGSGLHLEVLTLSTLSNRLTVMTALAITGRLVDRNRTYGQAIAEQRLQLESQAQLAELRQDFSSTLAHDLKPPLLGAIETLQAFNRGQFGSVSASQQGAIDIMIRSHQSTLKLVNTIQDIYRYELIGIHLDQQVVNLVPLTTETIATLQALAHSRNIHLEVTVTPSAETALWVKGDPWHLQRVFSNLLINGINHAPRGTTVNLHLIQGTTYHELKVSDQGLGIAPGDLIHLFDRFYQGSSDRQTQGSGLGLYLARQLVEAHGGTIWAENQMPHGAIFSLQLPALTQDAGIPSGEFSQRIGL